MSAVALDLADASVLFFPDFLCVSDADRLLVELTEAVAWRQEVITFYGRESPVPRLSAWHGDAGIAYTYSHITMQPEPWSPPLLEVKAQAEAAAVASFNSVLCNLYRTGRDSVAWHSDDEAELGAEPVIASVSLGDTRTFQMRHRSRPERRHRLELTHGSLLLMQGATQRHWRHQVPKTARSVGPRLNLTFRSVAASDTSSRTEAELRPIVPGPSSTGPGARA